MKIQTIETTAPTSIVEPSNHLHFQETPNMERINLGYSLKNIPIPSQKSYLKSFISKVDSFIHRIRWKAFFFERNAEDTNKSTDNNNDDTNANCLAEKLSILKSDTSISLNKRSEIANKCRHKNKHKLSKLNLGPS